DLQGLGAHGLPRPDKVVHPVDIVDIQRAEIYNTHALLLPYAIKVVSSSSSARRLSTSTQMETPGASMGCSRRSATTMPRQKVPPHSTRAGIVRTVTTLGSTAVSMARGSWTGQWS